MCMSGCANGCAMCWENAGSLAKDCMCEDGYEYIEKDHACIEKIVPDVVKKDDSDGENTTAEPVSANILKYTQFFMIALILVVSSMI